MFYQKSNSLSQFVDGATQYAISNPELGYSFSFYESVFSHNFYYRQLNKQFNFVSNEDLTGISSFKYKADNNLQNQDLKRQISSLNAKLHRAKKKLKKDSSAELESVEVQTIPLLDNLRSANDYLLDDNIWRSISEILESSPHLISYIPKLQSIIDENKKLLIEIEQLKIDQQKFLSQKVNSDDVSLLRDEISNLQLEINKLKLENSKHNELQEDLKTSQSEVRDLLSKLNEKDFAAQSVNTKVKNLSLLQEENEKIKKRKRRVFS